MASNQAWTSSHDEAADRTLTTAMHYASDLCDEQYLEREAVKA